MTEKEKVTYFVKLLLYTAKQEGAEVTPSKVQKIFFLLKMEAGIDLGLDFRPGVFGVFSEELSGTLNELVERGEVEEVVKREVRDPLTNEVIAHERYYVLKSEFEPEKSDEGVMKFFKEWVKKNRSEILNYVYKKYPEYNGYKAYRERIRRTFSELSQGKT